MEPKNKPASYARKPHKPKEYVDLKDAYIAGLDKNCYRPFEVAHVIDVGVVEPRAQDGTPKYAARLCLKVKYADREVDYIALTDALNPLLYVIDTLAKVSETIVTFTK